MGKTEEDWNGLKLGFLKTVQPNSFSKLIPAACNFINNAQETYLFVSDLWYLSFTCNFCAYFKLQSDWGRVIGKIKQTELDCHDTAPLRRKLNLGAACLPASINREIRHFHVVVVQWRQRNVQEKCDACSTLLFCVLNLLLFLRFRCRCLLWILRFLILSLGPWPGQHSVLASDIFQLV